MRTPKPSAEVRNEKASIARAGAPTCRFLPAPQKLGVKWVQSCDPSIRKAKTKPSSESQSQIAMSVFVGRSPLCRLAVVTEDLANECVSMSSEAGPGARHHGSLKFGKRFRSNEFDHLSRRVTGLLFCQLKLRGSTQLHFNLVIPKLTNS
jgi:hypothetical protein